MTGICCDLQCIIRTALPRHFQKQKVKAFSGRKSFFTVIFLLSLPVLGSRDPLTTMIIQPTIRTVIVYILALSQTTLTIISPGIAPYLLEICQLFGLGG